MHPPPDHDRNAPGGVTRRQLLAFGAALAPAALIAARARGQSFTNPTVAPAPLPPTEARGNIQHDFWRLLLDEFPLEPGHLYFDTASYGIPPLGSLEAIERAAIQAGSNASEADSEQAEAARDALAALLAAPPDSIALCGSDSLGMAWLADALTVNSIVLSSHEPPASAAPWLALARERSLPLKFLEPRFDPQLDRERVSSLVQSGSVLVVSHVASTTGQALAIGPLTEAAHARGGLVIVYGSAAAGVIPTDVTALGVDAYVASGHAWLLGPIGTAFVYVRPDLLPRLAPRQAPADLHAWSVSTWPRPVRRARDLEAIPVSAALAAGLHASIEWFSGMGLDTMRAQSLGLAQYLHTALAGVQGIELLTPAASVQTSPIVTFRVTKRPNTQVADWLLEKHRARLHRIDVRRMNAVRASPSLVTRVADIDALLEGVRALAL